MTDIYYTEIVAFGKIPDATALHESLIHRNGGFSFNRFIPTPLDGAYEILHEQRCNNWGSKWDCDNVNITLFSDETNGHVNICYCHYNTWQSSTPLIEIMSKLHPNLDYIVKSKRDPSVGLVEICTIRSSIGLRTSIVEHVTVIDDDEDGGVDIAYSYAADRKFIDDWSADLPTKKAMILLGYGEEERLFIAETHEPIHAGNRPLETA